MPSPTVRIPQLTSGFSPQGYPPGFDPATGLMTEDNPIGLSSQAPASTGKKADGSIDWASILIPIIAGLVGKAKGNGLLGLAAGANFVQGRKQARLEDEDRQAKQEDRKAREEEKALLSAYRKQQGETDRIKAETEATREKRLSSEGTKKQTRLGPYDVLMDQDGNEIARGSGKPEGAKIPVSFNEGDYVTKLDPKTGNPVIGADGYPVTRKLPKEFKEEQAKLPPSDKVSDISGRIKIKQDELKEIEADATDRMPKDQYGYQVDPNAKPEYTAEEKARRNELRSEIAELRKSATGRPSLTSPEPGTDKGKGGAQKPTVDPEVQNAQAGVDELKSKGYTLEEAIEKLGIPPHIARALK